MLWAYFAPGPYELALVALVALLLFAKRLPAVGRGLGRGIVELKKGLQGDSETDKTKPDETEP